MEHKVTNINYKKMTQKQKNAFLEKIEKMVNSDLKWMFEEIEHELDLSEKCIKAGDEKRL
jgi:hypothetical protein